MPHVDEVCIKYSIAQIDYNLSQNLGHLLFAYFPLLCVIEQHDIQGISQLIIPDFITLT